MRRSVLERRRMRARRQQFWEAFEGYMIGLICVSIGSAVGAIIGLGLITML